MQVSLEVPSWAARLVSDLGDMARSPRPVDAAREPAIELRLPDDVYFEYAFLDAAGTMRADPGNDRRADNPWYPEASALVGPEYRPDPLVDPPVPARPHRVDRLRLASELLQQRRRVIVTTPGGYEGQSLPWLLVQDGVAFYRLARLADVHAALIAAGRARPARIAFVEPRQRSREYAFFAPYRRFVEVELLPELRRRYPSTAELVVMGASLGGLFSATLALRRPDLVSAVATFSGAFLGHPEEPDFYRGRRSAVAETLEALPDAPLQLRWYAECGTLEWLTEVNRRVARALQRSGVEHSYRERHAGHNWTNWRNGLAGAVSFTLRP